MSKYVVVDFEMCDVPKGAVREHYNYGTEIIEIGAVLLDDSLNIVDNFKSYVAPQYGHIGWAGAPRRLAVQVGRWACGFVFCHCVTDYRVA